MKAVRSTCLFVLMLLVAACGGSADNGSNTTPTASVQVEAASLHSMDINLDVYGTVAFASQFQFAIDSTAPVVIEQVLVIAGATVRAGDPLLRIHPTADAASELQRAHNDLVAAEQAFNRVERLFSRQLATNADMTSARQSLSNAQANFQSAQTRIGSGGSATLAATSDGIVTSVAVSSGDIAAANTPLIHLSSTTDLIVRLGIEPSDLAAVKAGQPVTVSPLYARETSEEATISEVVSQVDSHSQLAQAVVALPATSKLVAGSAVHARIRIGRHENIISVPHRALLRDQQGAFVYVADAKTATRVNVTTGIDDGDQIEILSGIKPGDLIVVEGNYVLEDGMAVAVQKANPSP